MKLCETCGKQFGFLEKVYHDQEGKTHCHACVETRKQEQEPKEEKKEDFVELKDIPEATAKVNENVAEGWEFRVVKFSSDPLEKQNVSVEKFEETINKLGQDGWELVSVIPLHVLLMKVNAREEPAMIFKRPRKSLGY